MTASEIITAFCYLEQNKDEKNKISLTENQLAITYRGRTERYGLTQIKDLSFGHRKAMLYVIIGGIVVPFTAVAFYRDFLSPWPTLFLLFAGILGIYLGWIGYPVLTIHLFGVSHDYRLNGISKNIQAFVDFTLKLLPTNLPLSSDAERMIYHIIEVETWKKNKWAAFYRRAQEKGFIHASTYSQLQSTRNKYFKDQTGLLLLTIDPLKVKPEIRYEDTSGAGQLFPHIYGDLNLDAVVKVETIKN